MSADAAIDAATGELSGRLLDAFPFPPLGSRLSKRLVVIIFILALVPRLAFIAVRGPRVAPDTPYYTSLATNISRHRVYSLDSAAPYSPSIRIAPLYPAFLALLSFFGCGSPAAVAISQSILDSFLAVLLLLLARMVLTTPWAAAAALSYCLHPGAIYAASNILTETVFTALLLAAVYLLCTGLIKNRLPLALGAGVVLGCAILCRAIALPLPFILSGLLLWYHRLIDTPKAVLRNISIFILGAGLVVVPWTVRCSLVAHRLVPVQSAGAANFYIPTRWEWDQGDESRLWPRFVEQDPYGQRLYAARTPEEMVEADKFGYSLAMRNIRTSPGEYLASRIRNYPHLFLMSFDTFTGINASFSQLARQGDARLLIKLILLMSFSLVPFLAGVRSVFLHQNLVSVVCLSVWIYTLLVHLPMWIEYRFWQPAVPFLLISAALTGYTISVRWRRTEPVPGQGGRVAF